MSRKRVVVGTDERGRPLTAWPPQAAQEPAAGTAGADVQLDCLSVAVEAARLAWDAVAVAQTAWQVASEDLARAYADVAWLLDMTHADVIAPPVAVELRKGNTPPRSRANGTAAMLAKRAKRIAPKATAEKVYKRSPEARENMRQARLAGIERKRAEAPA